MPTPVVQIRNLSKTFHTKSEETLAIKDFTMDINEGEYIAIVGPSGCGKTTVLSILAGLVQPSSGQILYREKE